MEVISKAESKAVLESTGNTTYDGIINRYVETYNSSFDYEAIKEFIASARTEGKSEKTIAVYKAALKKAVTLSTLDMRDRAVISEAFKDIKVSKQHRGVERENLLSEEDVEKMKHFASYKHSLIIDALYKTGLRVSELLAVKLADCRKVDANYYSVSVLGKGRKVRRVFFSSSLIDGLRRAFNGSTYLIETKNGKKVSRHAVYNIVKRAGERIGREVSPHTLRHSFATRTLLKKGKSLKAVSRYLGHSSVSITADYYIHDELDYSDIA